MYDGEDNRDSIVRAAHDLARHSISMLDSSGTNFIYEPRTDVNFGSATTNESAEHAGVDPAGDEDVSRNEGDPNVRRDRDNTRNTSRKEYTCGFKKGFLK